MRGEEVLFCKTATGPLASSVLSVTVYIFILVIEVLRS